MDKVLPILQIIRRQHFWLLLGVVAIICVLGWWPAKGMLVSEFKTNQQAIEAEYQTIQQSIAQDPEHRTTN